MKPEASWWTHGENILQGLPENNTNVKLLLQGLNDLAIKGTDLVASSWVHKSSRVPAASKGGVPNFYIQQKTRNEWVVDYVKEK